MQLYLQGQEKDEEDNREIICNLNNDQKINNPTDNMATQQVSIDPIKYLSNLPIYYGDIDNLYAFTELVDRVNPLLAKYDDISQNIFIDTIKSRLAGKAREAIEINSSVNSWDDIKKLFFHNFGDRLSVEQLYDELKSLTFKTNCFDFYNEIKAMLRRLNDKTRIKGGTDAEIKSNCKTALKVFLNKIPEPMKGILCYKNPDTLEDAMQILHETGYAFTRNSCNMNTTNQRINQRNNNFKNQNNNTQKLEKSKNQNDVRNNDQINQRPGISKFNNSNITEQRRNYNQYNNNFNQNQNYNQNQNHNQNQNYNRQNNAKYNTVEPMDVDNSTINRRTYNIEENTVQKDDENRSDRQTYNVENNQIRNENFQLIASNIQPYPI